MSSINIGTIFALESRLPKFQQISTLIQMKPKERINALRSMSVFSDFKEQEPIDEFLIKKEEDLIADTSKVIDDDAFFSTLLWLRKNMVQIRKAFRNTYIKSGKEAGKTHFKEALQSLEDLREEYAEEILNTYNDLPLNLSNFELEKKLDHVYFRLLKKKTGNSWVKKAYSSIYSESYKSGSEKRIKFLENKEQIDSREMDEYSKMISNQEVGFVKRALTEMDDDLIILGYIIKIKYLFSNLQIIFADFGADDLLVDYSS